MAVRQQRHESFSIPVLLEDYMISKAIIPGFTGAKNHQNCPASLCTAEHLGIFERDRKSSKNLHWKNIRREKVALFSRVRSARTSRRELSSAGLIMLITDQDLVPDVPVCGTLVVILTAPLSENKTLILHFRRTEEDILGTPRKPNVSSSDIDGKC